MKCSTYINRRSQGLTQGEPGKPRIPPPPYFPDQKKITTMQVCDAAVFPTIRTKKINIDRIIDRSASSKTRRLLLIWILVNCLISNSEVCIEIIYPVWKLQRLKSVTKNTFNMQIQILLLASVGSQPLSYPWLRPCRSCKQSAKIRSKHAKYKIIELNRYI